MKIYNGWEDLLIYLLLIALSLVVSYGHLKGLNGDLIHDMKSRNPSKEL